MKNMENLTPKEINLDFYNKKTVTVNAKQYDKHSRYLLVTCYNHGSLFLLNNASYSAYIRYKKADELSVFQSCEITDDGKILIELTEQMLLVAGTCMADLLLVDEGTLSTDTDIPVITNDGNTIYISESSILSTMNFYINVSSSPLQNQDIESTSEFSALNDMLEKVHDSYAHVMENADESADKAERFMAQASKKADEADQSSKLSQSYAIGTNNEVREADSVDNAKYYYEQSKQIQDEVHKVAEGDLLINTASFTEADSRENIESGETLGTLFGKIKKWFSSLGTAAFHNVSNSLTQTSDGYVADARAVNSLATRVGELNDLATTAKGNIIDAINENCIKIEALNNTFETVKEDTGWIDIIGSSIANNVIDTPTAFAIGIMAPSGGGSPLQYRRKAGVVYIQGCFGINYKQSGNMPICTLPIGFRPTSTHYSINTATGSTISRYRITAEGKLSIEWVRKLSDGSEVTDEIKWLGVDMSYPI